MIVILKYSQTLYFSGEGLGKAMAHRADSPAYQALSRNNGKRCSPLFFPAPNRLAPGN